MRLDNLFVVILPSSYHQCKHNLCFYVIIKHLKMKNILRILALTKLILVFSTCIQAQEVVTTSGDIYTSASGSICFTVGEPVSETCEGSLHYLTQGFHQSNLLITSVFDLAITTIKISAYPNPVLNFVILRTESRLQTNMHVKVFDLNGKPLYQKPITSNVMQIPFSSYASATYLLVVFQGDLLIKTFKIEKK